MQNIPRVFGIIIAIGFFLNWYSVDILGTKMGFTGFTLAKTGGERYLMFIIPLVAIFSAAQPGRGNHAGSALLTAFFLLVFSPEGIGGDALTKDVGWWLCAVAAVAQLVTCFLAPKEDIQSPLVKSMMGEANNELDDGKRQNPNAEDVSRD
jgi:hypothetical protein